MSNDQHRVAVVQHPPVWLDRAATLERAVALVAEAVANGARLIVFTETFIPGYPDWIWKFPPYRLDIHEDFYARLVEQAVDVSSDDLFPLQEAANRHNVTIVCGIDEVDRASSGTTLYNTVVIIAPDGRILNRHRKLVPTNAERMVWGIGDASGLRPVETPSGKVAALICWENYMPMARFALFAQGVEIYIAPTSSQEDRWLASMRHIAFEGRCWVLGSGNIMSVDDISSEVLRREYLSDSSDGWINTGGSVIVNPDGEVVAGPLTCERGILYADCDPGLIPAKRYGLDVAGHYGRPDIFQLRMNRRSGVPIEFDDAISRSSEEIDVGPDTTVPL